MRFIMGCFCFLFGLPIASPLVAQQSQFQGSVSMEARPAVFQRRSHIPRCSATEQPSSRM